MRGIKFRAWHPDADIMVEWDRLKNLRYAIDNGSGLYAVVRGFVGWKIALKPMLCISLFFTFLRWVSITYII